MDFKPEVVQKQIPRFQRAYSWEKRHYAEFLTDIISNLRISDGTIMADAYFVGTMLFIGNFVDANKNVIKVVDGQQRLTTITILFSVLSDLFKENGDEPLAQRIFNYIMGKDDDNQDVRILKTKSNYPYFAFYIQDYKKEHIQEPDSEEEENIHTDVTRAAQSEEGVGAGQPHMEQHNEEHGGSHELSAIATDE